MIVAPCNPMTESALASWLFVAAAYAVLATVRAWQHRTAALRWEAAYHEAMAPDAYRVEVTP